MRVARSAVVTAVEPACETIRFRTRHVVLGEFRCPREYAGFRDAGRIRNHVVAFPHNAVWIERERERRFVADATGAVLHLPGLAYERRAISDEGDRSDWIATSEELAREIVGRFSSDDASSDQVFRFGRAAVPASLFRAQRELFASLDGRSVDRVEVEERAIALVEGIVRSAYADGASNSIGSGSSSARTSRPLRHATTAARELAEEAKAMLARTAFDDLSVSVLADRLDVSPFHLCRSFRQCTGDTLHGYRRRLRLRAAFERVAACPGSLSPMAIELGFCSHSHLTAAFRREFGVAPSRL